MIITYSESVFVALLIPLHSSTLSHKRHHSKRNVERKMSVLIFSVTLVCKISYSKKKLARCDKNVYTGLHVKYPLFLSDFNFLDGFSKSCQIKKFHEKSAQW